MWVAGPGKSLGRRIRGYWDRRVRSFACRIRSALMLRVKKWHSVPRAGLSGAASVAFSLHLSLAQCLSN